MVLQTGLVAHIVAVARTEVVAGHTEAVQIVAVAVHIEVVVQKLAAGAVHTEAAAHTAAVAVHNEAAAGS